MKLILTLFLLSSPAWAQEWPASTSCDAIMRELKMRPPAYGDPARADFVWNSYMVNCEKTRGGELDAEDVMALSKVLHPETFK